MVFSCSLQGIYWTLWFMLYLWTSLFNYQIPESPVVTKYKYRSKLLPLYGDDSSTPSPATVRTPLWWPRCCVFCSLTNPYFPFSSLFRKLCTITPIKKKFNCMSISKQYADSLFCFLLTCGSVVSYSICRLYLAGF